MRVNVRFIVFMFLIFVSATISAQGVFVVPSEDGRLSIRLSTNGTVSAGTYTPPCGCRADIILTRTPDNTISLEASTVWCLAKGLEGRGGEMLPSIVMYDRNLEVEAVRGKDGTYRASIPGSNFQFGDIFVFLVPRSTTTFDFTNVPWQSYGTRKTMIPVKTPELVPIPITPITSTSSAEFR